MRFWSAVPILLFLVIGGINSVHGLVAEEFIFFDDLRSANSGSSLGANASNPCSWHGINCSIDQNHVIAIQLNTRGILVIPPSIGNLTHLTVLQLGGNYGLNTFPAEIALIKNTLVELDISGTGFTNNTISTITVLTNLRQLVMQRMQRPLRLPENFASSFPFLEILSLPANLVALSSNFGALTNLRHLLCELPNLEVLDVHAAQIPRLPFCMNQLTRLRVLEAAQSQLTTFPNIYDCINLEEIRIQGSLISDQLDARIGNLVNLRIFNANGALMTRSIPDSITNLVNLRFFDMTQNMLVGTIPREIGKMRNLEQLRLADNELSGSIPDSISDCRELRDLNQLDGTIPSLTNPNLRSVLLDDNLLTGTIPASLGSLSQLDLLSLDNNQLSGTIPRDLSQLPVIQIMRMENNQLTGAIPQDLQNLTNINQLMLGFNELNGSVFDFGQLPLLNILSLQFNYLSGTIPDVFDRLPRLTRVQLQSNNFEGSIPQTLVGRNFIEINLSANRLSGAIPPGLLDIATAIDLSYNRLTGTLPINGTIACGVLQLQHNLLSGTLPDILGSWLEFLDLSDNWFEGPLPNLASRLTAINLSNNRLSGTFPNNYISFPLLASIDISHNFLTGTLPPFPGGANTPSIRHLDLSFNILTGTIPHSILTTAIQNIILSFNMFSGQIPRFNPFVIGLHTLRLNHNRLNGGISPLMFLPNVQVIDLTSNMLTGVLPALNARPRQLQQLRLSHNLLSGVIPPTFSNLARLEVLDLSFNRFVGQIPSQFSSMQLLREFLVAGNSFTGNIPPSFVNLPALEILDVTLNRLEGTFPSFIGEIYSLQQLFMGSNNLRGTIPLLFESLRAITILDLSYNQFSGEIPPGMFNLQRILRINLSGNLLTGTVPSSIVNLRTLEVLDLRNNQLTGVIPDLSNLRNLETFFIANNSFSGCIQLPQQFEMGSNRTASCALGGNIFCCAASEFRCEFTERCPLQQLLFIPQGSRVKYEDADSFDKLRIEEGGTLVIKPFDKINVECATIEGTIEIDMLDLEEEQYDSPFLYFSCGDTAAMKVQAQGKVCTVSTNIREKDGKQLFTAAVTCPDTSLDRGVLIAIVISVSGGVILFIVIGAVTYRYFRGKRRVEQLLNRVELLTLTTKSGDDQFSLPQWHAPEDYALKPIEDLPIQLTNTKFDFGTKGNLLQVDSMYKDIFRVQARTKASGSRGLIERLLEKSLRVNFHPVQSSKYQLTVDPFEIDVRDKGYVDVTLMLQMKMTTKTNISLWVEVPELKQFSLLEFVLASEPSPWIDIDEVDGVTESLGEGGFGAVYKARYRGQTIAFKKLKFQEMNIQQFEEFNREVQMMMNLHHRCIVQFIGASKVPGKLAILTEFVSGGNLQELLNTKQLDIGLKLKIALDVAEALQFLHANNILHRDIKAENVLVASIAKEASVNVKLTDFGTARSIVEEVTMKFTKGVGTPTYMAPEIMENKRYEKGADIYSFGILLWTIMAQQMPYAHLEHPWQVANMVLEGKRLPIPPATPVAIAELINKCWAQSADDRPSMDQVVQEINFLLASKV